MPQTHEDQSHPDPIRGRSFGTLNLTASELGSRRRLAVMAQIQEASLDQGYAKLSDLYDAALRCDQVDPTASVRNLNLSPPNRIRAEAHTLRSSLQPVLDGSRLVDEQWAEHGVDCWFPSWNGVGIDWRSRQRLELQPRLATMVGADEGSAIVDGTITLNLETALRMVHPWNASLLPRNKIVVHKFMFPSDRQAIDAHLRGVGMEPADAVIEVAPSLPRGIFAADDFKRVLTERKHAATTLVLEMAPYYSGQVLPVAEICQFARSLGYTVLVDGAHVGGVHPIHFNRIGAHIMWGCGYKHWGIGPGKTGWACFDLPGLEVIGGWRPTGWMGQPDEAIGRFGGPHVPDKGARRFIRSTPDVGNEARWEAMLRCYEQVGGIEVIHQEALRRAEFLIQALRRHPDFNASFGFLTPTDAIGGELALWFKKGLESGAVYSWLKNPTDGHVPVDLDKRIAFYDEAKPEAEREGITRIGLHPFDISAFQAVRIAHRLGTALSSIRQ